LVYNITSSSFKESDWPSRITDIYFELKILGVRFKPDSSVFFENLKGRLVVLGTVLSITDSEINVQFSSLESG
jgi:hypothetical protein